MSDQITPLILTFNEAPNIRRTLEKLGWAREVVVVDSFSTDETLEIVRGFSQARVVQRAFDSHAQQWNFGLEQIRSEWVLSMDADYVLSDDLITELNALSLSGAIAGYATRFKYCIRGKVLRASLYPPRTVLYRRSSAAYYDEGHTQLVRIAGQVQDLHGFIYHDDRKPLDRWLEAQVTYARAEAEYLMRAPRTELNFADKLRLWILPAPALVLFFTLLGKRLMLDGWPGWFYAYQRTLAEILLSLRLLEERFGHAP